MKKSILALIVLVFLTQIKVFSQSCLPEGIIFSTQTEIDNFQTNYTNCTEIEGNVVIQGNYILNLTGLNMLSSISGSLDINGNDRLYNISDLENLTSIGGHLKITDNKSISSLTGLTNINAESITDLTITNNVSLSTCEVLSICSYLTSPNGTVDIYNNATGCNSLGEVADACNISLSCLPFGNYYLINQNEIDSFQFDYPACSVATGNVTITGDDITNLNGLHNLTAIEESLFIKVKYYLTSLEGLDSLTSVGGDLIIDSNFYLNNLNGLKSLSFIGKDLKITNNFFSLISLGGLENITSINGDLIISRNQVLPNLSGLDNVSSIYDGLTLILNNSLTSLNGLNNLSFVNGIYTNGNHSLSNFIGLEKVTSINGSLSIINNYGLSSLSGLNNITSVGKSLSIKSTLVARLTDLDSLKTIGLHLTIQYNPKLKNLRGLENLTSIGGSLLIRHNEELQSLTGLENTTSVGSNIVISYNDVINSLIGMDNIDSKTIEALTIVYNPNLSLCEVESVCNYIIADSGYIGIYDNADNCNSKQEVKHACQSYGVQDISQASNFTIYPNPAQKEISFLNQNKSVINEINIYNQIGQKVIHEKEITDKINISALVKGIYIIEIVSDNLKFRNKLIINK